jgi:hypothetical protein
MDRVSDLERHLGAREDSVPRGRFDLPVFSPLSYWLCAATNFLSAESAAVPILRISNVRTCGAWRVILQDAGFARFASLAKRLP